MSHEHSQRAPGQISGQHSARRVVIITGGARGIGLGIGECFAKNGDAVVIADLHAEQAQKAAVDLSEMGGLGSIGFECDNTKPEQVSAMVQRVITRFGKIDVLVNNAGICPFLEVMEMTPDIWQRTLDVNLTGAFHCTQIVAREMIKLGKGGRIIFITSLAENVTNSNQVDYGASKAGLRMAMVGFATALGKHGITCNAVAPGMILTPLTAWHWEKAENVSMLKERVPMGRLGTARDIGNACIFLASTESDYITGITLRVDGGHQARCV